MTTTNRNMGWIQDPAYEICDPRSGSHIQIQGSLKSTKFWIRNNGRKRWEWLGITDSLNLNPNHWSNRQLENNYSLLEGGEIVHRKCNNIQMGEHVHKELWHPGWMVGAQVLQPAVPVQDSQEPGQLTGHLVHQVTPDRSEQIITSSTWGYLLLIGWAWPDGNFSTLVANNY